MSYEIQGHSHRCAATGRELEEGETYYAAVQLEDGKLVRRDFSQEAWQGAPAEVVGYWKGRVPGKAAKVPAQAEPRVLLELFEQLQQSGDSASGGLRYLLALMLLRRKVVKLADVQPTQQGQRWVLQCPRNNQRYEVLDAGLSPEQLAAQQEQLTALLEDSGGMDLSEARGALQ